MRIGSAHTGDPVLDVVLTILAGALAIVLIPGVLIVGIYALIAALILVIALVVLWGIAFGLIKLWQISMTGKIVSILLGTATTIGLIKIASSYFRKRD